MSSTLRPIGPKYGVCRASMLGIVISWFWVHTFWTLRARVDGDICLCVFKGGWAVLAGFGALARSAEVEAPCRTPILHVIHNSTCHFHLRNYICMHVVHTYTHTYRYVYVYMYIYLYVCMCIYVYRYVCAYMYIHLYICIYIQKVYLGNATLHIPPFKRSLDPGIQVFGKWASQPMDV